MIWKVNPLEGKTINWRAGCGKTASPVRREGELNPIGSPYPYKVKLLGFELLKSAYFEPPTRVGGFHYIVGSNMSAIQSARG